MKQNEFTEKLLVSFTKEKMALHQEPERKGTPKGDVIGHSLVKYTSILLWMTSLEVKAIAERLNVSYGLVRVWRTETEYQKVRRQLIKEFASLYIDRLVDYTVTYASYDRKKKRPKAMGFGFTGTPINVFSDIVIFHEDLLEAIYELAQKIDFKKYNIRGLKNEFLKDVLPLVWGMRKGLFTATEDGAITVKKQYLDKHTLKGDTIFVLAEALSKPWKANKELVNKAMMDFLQKVGL